MTHDRVPLGRLVTDTIIVGERNPAAPTHFRQPLFIWRIVSKVIGVSLDRKTSGFQNGSEPLAEIAVSEPDLGQAARS